MEMLSSKKIKESQFCDLCEKERKHLLVTYQDINSNNETYTFEVKRCKSCGKEQTLV